MARKNEEVSKGAEVAPATDGNAEQARTHDTERVEAVTEAPQTAENSPRNTQQPQQGGEVNVKYIGRMPRFRDSGTRTVFEKNEPVAVSAEDAERLTSMGDSQQVFVRADN